MMMIMMLNRRRWRQAETCRLFAPSFRLLGPPLLLRILCQSNKKFVPSLPFHSCCQCFCFRCLVLRISSFSIKTITYSSLYQGLYQDPRVMPLRKQKRSMENNLFFLCKFFINDSSLNKHVSLTIQNKCFFFGISMMMLPSQISHCD